MHTTFCLLRFVMVSICTTLTLVQEITTQLVSNEKKRITSFKIIGIINYINYCLFIWIILLNSAIIINPKFTANKNNEIWSTINGHINKLKQDVFKQAGVSVEIYTKTNIKLSRGKAKLNYILVVILTKQLNSLELLSTGYNIIIISQKNIKKL